MNIVPITLADAKRQLGQLKKEYEDVLETFNEKIVREPHALFPLISKVSNLNKREVELLERMKASFPEGSEERMRTRTLYREEQQARSQAYEAIERMKK